MGHKNSCSFAFTRALYRTCYEKDYTCCFLRIVFSIDAVLKFCSMAMLQPNPIACAVLLCAQPEPTYEYFRNLLKYLCVALQSST